MKKINIMKLTFFMFFCISTNLWAQQGPTAIDAAEHRQIVDSIKIIMQEHYVFKEKGYEMANLIDLKFKSGEYKQLSDPEDFAKQITEDLISVSNDLHISVRYAPQRIALMRKATYEDNDELEKMQSRLYEYSNFRFF